MEERMLYKLEILSIKTIPMILAAISLLNTTLSYFDIDAPVLSYIGGVSLLPLLFLYLSSYVFKFCTYHRLFLHYIAVTEGVNLFDLYIGVPVSDRRMFLLYFIITGIFIFLLLYYHQKCKKEGKLSNWII